MPRLLILALLGCSNDSADTAATQPSHATDAVWGSIYDGRDPTVPFFPDQSARYWRYAFERPAADAVLRIKGTLVGARYQAVDLYDDETRTSIGALNDSSLEAAHTVLLTERDDIDGTVVTPPEDAEIVSVFFRLYVPDQPDLAGPLPVVDLLDPETGESLPPPEPLPAPEVSEGLIGLLLASMTIEQRAERVDFYNQSSESLYAAADNQYLTAQITREPDEVVLIRFQPPTWSDGGQVRYWSLSQGDRASLTHHTLVDRDANLSDDGWLTLVIGDDTAATRTAAAEHHFVPWSTPEDELVLIYRNLLAAADFDGNPSKVPLYDASQSSEGQEATAYLGDHAPRGIRCAAADFTTDGCSSWLEER